MNDQHPIPPELMEEWIDAWYNAKVKHANMTEFVAIQAARWGADQELEACYEWFLKDGWNPEHPNNLRAARRPKPLSLKEQALEALYQIESECPTGSFGETIRRALEQLDD